MKKLLWLPLCALVFVLARDTRRAHACGGPSVVAPEVVLPPHLLAAYDNDGLGMPRKEERFLYPYLLAYPKEAQPLWRFAYESLSELPAPDERPYLRANSEQHPDLARKEAQKLLDEWYALPPVPAAAHREIAMRAAKFLEPAGSAPKSSPTQQYLDLVQHFTSQVPNGWQTAVTAQVPAAFWVQEFSTTQAWLKANPAHPLRDLVLLWQVRVARFSGDPLRAWALLFQLYPRRRTRVLAEMRYLLQQSSWPSEAQLDAVPDPLLAASLLTPENASPARWERYWRLSQTAPRKVEALALQERLLQALVGQGQAVALPASFPKQAAKPSQYWGELRGLLLLRHGQLAQAQEQLAMLSPSAEQAMLLANCYLAMGDPVQAARTPLLAPLDASYLIEVVTPRALLPKLRTDSNELVAASAEAALTAELIRGGDFKAAARAYKPVAARQAAEFERMAALQKQGDELGLARALRARGNDLGLGMPSDYYRGFSMRYAQLAPDSAEAKGLIAVFGASSGGFQALRHFVPWLEAHAKERKARAVLAEADDAYIALQSFGGWPNLFWAQYLTNHELAVRLRRVGKQIRLNARTP